MNTVKEFFGNLLSAVYNLSGSVIKSLFVDLDGTPGAITQPMDYNIGAIGSTLEWLRRLTLDLVDQLFLDIADPEYVSFTIEDFLGIGRYDGETDADLIDRVKILLFGQKMTVPAIIEHCSRFSTPGPPSISEGGAVMAYADVSYSDVYGSWQNQTPGPEFDYWIFPAMSSSGAGQSYYFILTLQNTGSQEIVQAVDLVNKLIAAGVDYDIIIETV